MTTAIRVEGLSKKYVLSHQGERGHKQYKTLRDTMADAASAPFRKLGGLFTSSQPPTTNNRQLSSREDFWALNDVSFDIKQGEAVGIIGRNGAGKSTLLKLLSRITSPTKGRIEINGRVASLLEVGTGFHPELTGRENIYLNGAILGMARTEIKSKFDQIVAFAEVEKFLDTPVKRYSSGMYVRLAFAVAAHLDPEILIIDEVLAVGDAEFQKKCLGKMEDVSQSGRTVIFVSHQMNAVERLCSRAILLRSGKLHRESDDVRSVTQEYLFGEPGSSGEAQSEWINSQKSYKNPWFHPTRLYLADAQGKSLAGAAPCNAEIWITLEGEIEELDAALTIGYALYNEEGVLLYWSYQTDKDPAHWPKLSCGRVTLKSPLPPRLLNEGLYRIELIGGLHHRKWLFEPGVNAPFVMLNLQGEQSDSPLWLARRPGLLAPVYPWEIKN